MLERESVGGLKLIRTPQKKAARAKKSAQAAETRLESERRLISSGNFESARWAPVRVRRSIPFGGQRIVGRETVVDHRAREYGFAAGREFGAGRQVAHGQCSCDRKVEVKACAYVVLVGESAGRQVFGFHQPIV